MPEHLEKPKIVVTNALWDDATKRSGAYLKDIIEKCKEKLNAYDVRLLRGVLDTKENYRREAPSACLHIGTGHGRPPEYLGWANKGILNTEDERKYKEGMIHYLVACHLAKELGPNLIKDGAKAFLGFKDEVKMVASANKDPLKDRFLKATIGPLWEGLPKLLEGGTIQEAKQAIFRALQREFHEWKDKNQLVAGIIEWNYEQLQLMGDPNARLIEPQEPPSPPPSHPESGDLDIDLVLEPITVPVEIKLKVFGYTIPFKTSIEIPEQRLKGKGIPKRS